MPKGRLASGKKVMLQEVEGDGNEDDGDACLNTCRNAVCGDGVTRTDRAEWEDGFESCYDGNADPRDACTNSCILARCGDAIVRNDLQNSNQEGWEDCDDGNQNLDDDCVADCQPARCGDGYVRSDLELTVR